MRTIRMTFAVALALFLAGCATAPVDREVPADGSASAFVLNRSEFGMTVYVAGSANRYRLGFVDAMSSGRFRIPGEMVLAGGSFSLVAEGRGVGPDYISDPFVIQPGYIANWRLPDNDIHVR
jgi:hypothetical protein